MDWKRYRILMVALLAAVLITQGLVKAKDANRSQDVNAIGENKPAELSRLAVLWTSGEPDVANNVCLMYTHEAKRKGWFDEVVLIVWGPSAKLLAEDTQIQQKCKEMAANGVIIQACIACAKRYGVVEDLRRLGIEVKGMGRPLSAMLKGDYKMLTF